MGLEGADCEFSEAHSPGVIKYDKSETMVAIVAVANDQRGVISPCGRCRQMLFDYHPEIRVIVRNACMFC